MTQTIFSQLTHYYPNLLLLLVLIRTFPEKKRQKTILYTILFFILLCVCDHFSLEYSARDTVLLGLRAVFFVFLYIGLALLFAHLSLEGWYLYQLTVITMWWFFYGVARSILFATAQAIDPALEKKVLPILVLNDLLQTIFSVILIRLRINSSLHIRPLIPVCLCVLSVFTEELVIRTRNYLPLLDEIGLLQQIIVLMICFVMFVLFMYWCVSMLLHQLESLFLTEHQSALQKMELDLAKEMYQQSRKTAHDIKNHLMVMSRFLEQQQYEPLSSYLHAYQEHNQPFLHAISSGNTAADAILYREQQKALRENIPFYVDAALPAVLNIPMTELGAFLFNGIDNAIEASRSVANPEVHVTIRMRERFCVIVITNRTDTDVLKENPRLHTTKAAGELHGYGTRIMQDFADKYNGNLQFSQEGTLFKVSLMVQEVPNEL